MGRIFAIWDLDGQGNVLHIADHHVTQDEVEEVLESDFDPGISRSSGHDIAIGHTKSGRRLCVVFERIDDETVYPSPRSTSTDSTNERSIMPHIERKSRGRPLTKEEASRYAKIREEVEREKPQIVERARQQFDLMRGVGAAIRAARETQGLTLEQLGERAGMDPSALAKIELGQRNCTLSTLQRLAIALGQEVVVSFSARRSNRGKKAS